jgi:hypothetical protein
MIALIPLINFIVATVGIISALGVKYDLEYWYIGTSKRNETYMQFIIFFIMIPYHTILSVAIFIVAVIPAALIFPFMIIPSYYLNIKRYFAIMSYWWKGNRFQGNVEVEKMAPEVQARIKKNSDKLDN